MLQVAVVLPTSFTSGGEFLADVAALEAAGAAALLVEDSTPASLVALAAAAALTHRVNLGCISNDDSQGGLEAVNRLSGGRASSPDRAGWAEIDLPEDRAAWNQTLAAQESAGMTGVIVRWDPRLVDLLRNPDGDDDRSDLVMSTG